MISVDFVILGCGWAGILSAYNILKKYPNAKILILEKEQEVGGLLRSEIINGFTFDIGGSHIIFSRNENTLQTLLNFLGNNVVKHRRKTFILFDKDFFIKYPIENNLYYFDKFTRAEILYEIVEKYSNYKDQIPKNFLEWIEIFFGNWLAKNYMIPYNEKIWKRDLKEISVDWVFTPGRLPFPSLKEIIYSAIGIRTEGYKEQSIFYYPKVGGIFSLFKSVFDIVTKNKNVEIMTRYEISKIKVTQDNFIIDDKIISKYLISTIPLNELVEKIENKEIPNEIYFKVKKLDFNSLITIGVGIKKKAPNQHWIYVPSEKIVFHRYSWISNYSKFNAPKGFSSLLIEISVKEEKPEISKYVERAIEDLEYLEIARENEILFYKNWFFKYAYPVPTITSESYKKEITTFLNSTFKNLILIGRWGSWIYQNTDKVLEDVQKFVVF